MSWATEIEYYQLSQVKNTSFSTENKTVQRFNIEFQQVANAPVGTFETVRVPYDVEYVRAVTTVVRESVYECRGIEEGTAKSAVMSNGAANIVTGSFTMTVVKADRCNAAGGWMVTKTITEQVVTRGDWQLWQEAT